MGLEVRLHECVPMLCQTKLLGGSKDWTACGGHYLPPSCQKLLAGGAEPSNDWIPNLRAALWQINI